MQGSWRQRPTETDAHACHEHLALVAASSHLVETGRDLTRATDGVR